MNADSQTDRDDALRRSEARYRALVEATSQAVWSWIPGGVVGDFNRAREWWAELTGQMPAIGESQDTWLEVVHPEDRAAAAAAWEKATRTGGHYDSEYRVRSRQGAWRWVRARGVPVAGDDGTVAEWVGTLEDVTDQWQADHDRARLAAIVESSDDAIVSKTLDGVIQSWNRAAERVFGYTAEEAVGQPITLIIPVDRRDEEPAILARLCRGERVDHFETVRRRKDGRLIDISLTISPVRDGSGRIVGASKVARDITERKRAEALLSLQNERMRLLWEAAAVLLTTEEPVAMMHELFGRIGPHLGLDAYLHYMLEESGESLRLESALGIPPEQQDALLRLEPGLSIPGRAALKRELLVEIAIQASNEPRVQKEKQLGLQSYVCIPLIAGDRLLGTLSFASRTRDQFDAEEQEFLRTVCRYATVAHERLRLIRELRDADHKKDDFIALLAHELRNPLAPIQNGLEIIRLSGGDAATVSRAQVVMDRQLGHMVRLIDDLLDVSRIGRNKMELRIQRIALADAVSSAVEASRPLIDAAGHELILTFPAEPVFVDADLTRLAQVFGNLLTNSAKYTPRGGVIHLAVRRDEAAAVITIADNGIGIPPRSMATIFDMFNQLNRSIERNTGGLGIGLAIVKGLVEMHGGSVAAASPGEGLGSTFTVSLPLARASLQPPVNEGPGPKAVNRRMRKILVVDDNRDSAETMAGTLRLLGDHVQTAHDGLEAVAAAESFQPDVILMDVGMPRMNGLEAARRIREQPWGRNIFLVAQTGWGQSRDRELTEGAGFDAHLVKPVLLSDLQHLLAARDGSRA